MRDRAQIRGMAVTAYETVAERHSAVTRWATATDRQRAGVLLIAALIDLVENTDTLSDLAPWRIAAAGMDASVRLGLAANGWGDLEPGLLDDLDCDELSGAEAQWLEVVEELLEQIRITAGDA